MVEDEWIDAIEAAIELWRDVEAEEIYGPAYFELQQIRNYLIERLEEEQ